MEADPLAGINDIDWSSLTHAYGPADDVPGLLRSLRSKDEEVRNKTYFELYGNIYHQGTRYEASVVAIPFLYSLLDAEDTPQRGELLHLIVSLAVGFPHMFVPDGLKIGEWRAHIEEIQRSEAEKEDEAESDSDDDESDGEEWEFDGAIPESQLVLAGFRTYEAVQSGLSSVHRLLSDGDAKVRAMAAFALAFFPERFEENRPTLLNRLTEEEDASVRATVLVAMVLLCNSCADGDIKASTLPLLEEQCRRDSAEPFSRWISALVLVMLGNLDPQNIEEVIRRVADPKYLGESEPDENLFPFTTPDLDMFISSILMPIKGTEHPETARLIANKLPTAKTEGYVYSSVAEIAVEIAFDASLPKPIPPYSSLSHFQQEIITAVATRSKEEDRKLGLYFQGLLKSWERPTPRDLKEYIAASTPAGAEIAD